MDILCLDLNQARLCPNDLSSSLSIRSLSSEENSNNSIGWINKMRSFSVTVRAEVAAQQIKTFEHIVPIDLASIFKGYGSLPAVEGTQKQTGAWDSVGQTRTVILSDGSSAQEILTEYEHPHYFSYTVRGFSGVFRFLTSSAHGEWWFESNSSKSHTHIRWRYTLDAKSILAAPILWFIANFLWRGYMKNVVMLCKKQVEHKFSSSYAQN
jgi:hypothetical protein